jgi:hypothetical protein
MFEFEFERDLDGVEMFTYMFHSKMLANTTLYDGWNFSSPYNWDDFSNPHNFWYNKETTILCYSQKYTIGVH